MWHGTVTKEKHHIENVERRTQSTEESDFILVFFFLYESKKKNMNKRTKMKQPAEYVIAQMSDSKQIIWHTAQIFSIGFSFWPRCFISDRRITMA